MTHILKNLKKTKTNKQTSLTNFETTNQLNIKRIPYSWAMLNKIVKKKKKKI